jgi:hypothetical protein
VDVLKTLIAVERFAEGKIGDRTAAKWRQKVGRYSKSIQTDDAPYTAEWIACSAIEHALIPGQDGVVGNQTCFAKARATGKADDSPEFTAVREAEARNLSEVFRDIVGNPFRTVVIDPSWLTSTVITLANSIYSNRTFDHIPILADALQDAGCEDADILAHCRGPGPHVRGCWVVDLILGKQ